MAVNNNNNNKEVAGILLLLIASLLLCCPQRADAGNVTGGGLGWPGPPGDGRRSSEKMLAPIYKMATFYLESVVESPKLADLNDTQDLSSFRAMFRSARTDWPAWLRHYRTYVVGLAFGALYVVALPVAGCVVCACRSRGRCAGRPSGRPNAWCRRICTGLLLLVAVGLLFGVTGMFLANAAMRGQTRAGGLPASLKGAIARLGAYVRVAKRSYADYKENALAYEIQLVNDDVDRFGENVRDRVGNETNIRAFLDALGRCAATLDGAAAALAAIDGGVAEASARMLALSDRLAEVRSNVTRDLASCGAAECRAALDATRSLTTPVNLTGADGGDHVTRAAALAECRRGASNLDTNLAAARRMYDRLADIVGNASESNRTSLGEQTDAIGERFGAIVNATASAVDGLSLDRFSDYVDDHVTPVIRTYGAYFYYGGLAVCCMILLIVALSFLGLLYGACGGVQDQTTECCRKGHARPILIAALTAVFAFAPVVALVVAGLFPVGGVVHNDLCRSMDVAPPDERSARIVDRALSESLDFTPTVLGVYRRCRQNSSLYAALRIDERLPDAGLSDVVDLGRYDIQPEVDRLKSAEYLSGALRVLDDGLLANVSAVNSSLSGLDLAPLRRRLADDVTSYDLAALADRLRSASGAAPSAEEYAEVVGRISAAEYRRAEAAVQLLSGNVAAVQSFQDAFGGTLALLGDTRRDVEPSAVSSSARLAGDELLAGYRRLLAGVERAVGTSLAPCDTLADAIADARDAVCRDLLQPYNAFWFSASWCLVFFVALVPTVLALIDRYWLAGGAAVRSRSPPERRRRRRGQPPGGARRNDDDDDSFSSVDLPRMNGPAARGRRTEPPSAARYQDDGWEWHPDDQSNGVLHVTSNGTLDDERSAARRMQARDQYRNRYNGDPARIADRRYKEDYRADGNGHLW